MLLGDLTDKFLSTWNYSPRNYVFTESLLIVSYVQGALRKELLMAPFVKRFKNSYFVLNKSYC